MDKETKLRSVLFFVIGFLLVLSLIICIYIVAGESKLVPVEATVVEVEKDVKGVGVDRVKIDYSVNGETYNTAFETKKEYKENDEINVYYYKDDVRQVKYSKTSKLIFLCPVVGLVLCSLGLFELYRRKNDGEDEFKTSVIGVIGNTQQLKIVTENTEPQEYVTTPEEKVEVEVKKINKPIEEEIPQQLSEVPEDVEMPAPAPTEVTPEVAPVATQAAVEPIPVAEQVPVAEPAPAPVPVETQQVESEPIPETTPEIVQEETPVPNDVNNVDEVPVPISEPVSENVEKGLEETLMEKVKDKTGDKIEVSETELKEAIKDVLADVIKEVKQEKTKKEIVQVRVIPNYYYISGTSLMYEEAGKEQKELDLKQVKSVVRTINEAGVVVKLVVESPEVKCILTNMKNIDLEQLANLLRNKMRAMDENFEEVIEHKEY